MKTAIVVIAFFTIVGAQIQPTNQIITDPSCAAVTCPVGVPCVYGKCIDDG